MPRQYAVSTAVSTAVRTAVWTVLIAVPLSAQSIASRVASAPDGIVRLQYASRSGVCGDGRDVIGYRSAIFARNFQSIGGHWSESRCVPGPLRVTLTVENHQVTQLRSQVGGSWPAGEPVTDLGVVAPGDASAYLFSLVPTLESTYGKDRLLIPAVLAADAPVNQPLLAIARDEDRSRNTRRSAIQWLGLVGDASVVPALAQFARSDDDGKKSIADAALAALASVEDGAGVTTLMDFARTGSVEVRRNAVFWLGQTGDPRALRMLHSVIENDREASKVRANAVFALAHGADVPEAEFDYLRSVYARVDDDEVQDQILMGMKEDERAGAKWLIGRALDTKEATKQRKNALFWAGQTEATPISELVRVYRDSDSRSLQEHAIFVLSQRSDETATDALIKIAREDRDKEMRGKALFWLAQKKDPRVRKLIADMVLR